MLRNSSAESHQFVTHIIFLWRFSHLLWKRKHGIFLFCLFLLALPHQSMIQHPCSLFVYASFQYLNTHKFFKLSPDHIYASNSFVFAAPDQNSPNPHTFPTFFLHFPSFSFTPHHHHYLTIQKVTIQPYIFARSSSKTYNIWVIWATIGLVAGEDHLLAMENVEGLG